MKTAVAARTRRWIVAAALTALGIAAAWISLAREDWLAQPAAARSDTRRDGSAAVDDAPSAESASPSKDGDAPSAERVREPITVHAPRELPVTWVEGQVTLHDRQVNELIIRDSNSIDDDLVDPARVDGSFVPEWIDAPDLGRDEDAKLDDRTAVALDDPRRVRVVRGRFRFDSHGATAMRMRGLVLEGHAATTHGRVELRSDRAAAVDAYRVPSTFVHVVDAGTGDELRDVTIVGRTHDAGILPGLVRRADVVARGDSPFLFVPSDADNASLLGRFWVGAPGHAWLRTWFGVDAGGEAQTIELDEGAALVVVVAGLEHHPTSLSILRLPRLLLRDPTGNSPLVAAARREIEAQRSTAFQMQVRGPRPTDAAPIDVPLLDILATPEPMEFDGLPSGDYVASIEVGDSSARRRVLCSAEVKLRIGETERVSFTIPPDHIVRTVQFAGTIRVPRSWRNPDRIVLEIAPDDVAGAIAGDSRSLEMREMPPIASQPDCFRWRFTSILPGTYRIAVPVAGFETRAVVDPSGTSDVVLDLPDAAELAVRIVGDEAPGEAVRFRQLTWIPETASGARLAPVTSLEFDEDAGAFVGSVASGRGRFTGDGEWFSLVGEVDGAEARQDVQTGHNDITLRAQRKCGVEIVLTPALFAEFAASDVTEVQWTCLANGRAGGQGVRPTWSTHELAASDDAGSGHAILFFPPVPDGDEALGYVSLPEPGRYRFRLFDHPSIAPFEVDVPKGDCVTYTIEK